MISTNVHCRTVFKVDSGTKRSVKKITINSFHITHNDNLHIMILGNCQLHVIALFRIDFLNFIDLTSRHLLFSPPKKVKKKHSLISSPPQRKADKFHFVIPLKEDYGQMSEFNLI